MIPPIDIECPFCMVPPGNYCRTLHPTYNYHHAERIDAAARLTTKTTLPRIARHQELSDAEVHQLAVENLREAYKALRDHHVTETTVLATRVKRMRTVYEIALDWRRRVTLGSSDWYTEALIKVIDTAIAAEAEEVRRG